LPKVIRFGYQTNENRVKGMEYEIYNNPEIWLGGYYELSMEFGPFGDNERVNEALKAMVECDFFNGLWPEKKDFYKNAITPPINIEAVNQFYGIVTTSTKVELPCLVSVIRVEGESDWIDISIPIGYLEKYYPCKYPLIKEINPWISTIDEMYSRIAEYIFRSSPFDFAMMGEEISGFTNQQELTVDMVNDLTCILPTALKDQLGVQEQGETLTNGLTIFNRS
jgi:hypothetical protein